MTKAVLTLTILAGGCRAGRSTRPTRAMSVRDGYRRIALLLGFGERCGNVVESSQMLFNVGIGVLHRDRPLLIPPVGLRHHAAVDHAEPVMPPEININGLPVAIIHDLFGIEHQR